MVESGTVGQWFSRMVDCVMAGWWDDGMVPWWDGEWWNIAGWCEAGMIGLWDGGINWTVGCRYSRMTDGGIL